MSAEDDLERYQRDLDRVFEYLEVSRQQSPDHPATA